MKARPKVSACMVARMEDDYLCEWVDHYLSIGFHHLYIYDNNLESGQRITVILQPYIEAGTVTVHSMRGMEQVQMSCYQTCYNDHRTECDYMVFVDADEMIHLTDGMSITDLVQLPELKNSQVIRLTMLNHTDSGHAYKTQGTMQERFPLTVDPYARDMNGLPNACFTKCIVRCGTFISWQDNTHMPSVHDDAIVTNAMGEQADHTPRMVPCLQRAWVDHYQTKSLEEWLIWRSLRSDAIYASYKHPLLQYVTSLLKYFQYNEVTTEKIDLVARFTKAVFIIDEKAHDENEDDTIPCEDSNEGDDPHASNGDTDEPTGVTATNYRGHIEPEDDIWKYLTLDYTGDDTPAYGPFDEVKIQ